jgi:hypothetical protein
MKSQALVFGLVFSLLVCSGNLVANEKHGTKLVITKSDGQQITGELIVVKPSSLLLLDSQTRADVSVETGEISVIKIIRKSKAWEFGFITAFFVGIPIGIKATKLVSLAQDLTISTASYMLGVAICAPICAIPGALAGAYLGKDKTIQIAGKSPEEVKAVMEKLRTQARITDFQ